MGSSAIEIEKLSPEDRLQLIEELWESLRRQPETRPRICGTRSSNLDWERSSSVE